MEYDVPEAKGEVHEHHTHGYEETDQPADIDTAAEPKKQDGKFHYHVHIITGTQLAAGAGSFQNVYVKLIGDKAKTNDINIASFLKSLQGSFQRQTVDVVEIRADHDLGDVHVVTLSTDGPKNDWYVNKMAVHNIQSGRKDEFPCYHWIQAGSQTSTTSCTALLEDVADNPILIAQRKKQLEERKEEYKWMTYPEVGLPSSLKADTLAQLPVDQHFEGVKTVDFTKDAIESAAKLGFDLIQRSEPEFFDNLHKYEELAQKITKPSFPIYQDGRWQTDVEFGRQMLNGVNPVVIDKCTSLPPNFPVTNDMVKPFFNRGLTLEEEMKGGHMYICNLEIMNGLPCRKGYYSCAPMCLLYVNGSNQLVPIAIQLNQHPGDGNPIFLPSDNYLDWLLAKIYYRSAHSQFHELSTHYLSCHAAMEAYSMATMRNLPDPHPINKLLLPHFRYTMNINVLARATLINEGGTIDQAFAIGGEGKEELFRRAFSAYSVHWTNIRHSVEERGVDDPTLLPGYYYRDDGKKVWEAIESYARRIIEHFYHTDERVRNDTELQAWAQDIHTTAFPAFRSAPDGHGFPEKIESKEELTELCTLIMFTGSAQHASINFGQYDIYGFIPNAPFGMCRPPPTAKGMITHEDFLHSLPDKATTALSISLTYLLSQYSQDEIFLGNYPYTCFTEEAVQHIIQEFQQSLGKVTAEIQHRNRLLDVPYEYFLSGKVPNSITI